MAMGLGSLLGVSALMLGLSSPVVGGQSEGDLDRGENPVVDSLPCRIDPTLDLIFWEGQGLEDPGFMPAFYPATIGICGSDLENDIVDADGEPYGVIDDGYDWGSMGLQKVGWIQIPRHRVVNGALSAWVWTPSGYIGGELCLNSTVVDGKAALSQNAVEVPISALAQMVPSGNGTVAFYMEVTPPAHRTDLPVIEYQVVINQYVVRIQQM